MLDTFCARVGALVILQAPYPWPRLLYRQLLLGGIRQGQIFKIIFRLASYLPVFCLPPRVQKVTMLEGVELVFGEAVEFTAITVLINSLVFVLCGILELVERYDLFKYAKIQKKVNKII